MKRFCSALFFLFLCAAPAFAAGEPKVFGAGAPEKKLDAGEKLVYGIRYLGIPVGESEAQVSLEEYRGKKVYRVKVRVRSRRAIDWIYKVRDEHDSWIDAETLASLRYEKKIREGFRRSEEILEFDYAAKKVRSLDADGKVLKESDLPDGPVQDALSCGYYTRTLDFKSGEPVFIPVHADGKNWNMEVKFYEKGPIDIGSIGRFEALRSEPVMEFQGIFIRKGRIEGWISLDPKRIPLRMKVKIPVLGQIAAELTSYQRGSQA